MNYYKGVHKVFIVTKEIIKIYIYIHTYSKENIKSKIDLVQKINICIMLALTKVQHQSLDKVPK